MEIKHDFRLTKGLGLYLPPGQARDWERAHRSEDNTRVSMELPLSILRSVFEVLGVMVADDAGTLLSRYQGMSNDIASTINHDLTIFYKMLVTNGMKHQFKFNRNVETGSWALSRERGWDQAK